MVAYDYCPKCHHPKHSCVCHTFRHRIWNSIFERPKKDESTSSSYRRRVCSPSSSDETPSRDVPGSPRELWLGLSLALFALSLLMGLAMLVVWWTGIFSLELKTHCTGAILAAALTLVLVVIVSVYPLKHKLLCENCGWLGSHEEIKCSVAGGICPECKRHKYLVWKKPAELKRAEARSLAIKAKVKEDKRKGVGRHQTRADRLAKRLSKIKNNLRDR